MEARVPFLDHRVVEFLASIPSDQHKDLFWNKNIVRQALQRAQPAYPKDKEKVPFIATSKDDSLPELYCSIAKNTYPAFQMIYQDRDDTPFTTEAMDVCFHNIEKNSTDRHDSAYKLIEMMVTTIFTRFISEPNDLLELLPENSLVLPSALTQEQLSNLDGFVASSNSTQELNLNSFIITHAGNEILTNINEGTHHTSIYLLVSGKIFQHLQIPNSDFWVIQLLEEIANNPDGIQLGELLKNTEIAQQAFVNGLYFLQSKGFISFINS